MKALAVALLGLLLSAGLAHSQSADCTFSVSDLDFGAVDALSGAVETTSGTLSADCTNDVRRVCPSIGAGSGGATSATRLLRNDATGTTLDLQLYDNAGQTWGSTHVTPPGGEPPAIELNASGDATVQIFGRVTPALTRTGTYSSVFSDTNFVFGGPGLDCSNPVTDALGTDSPAFTASALLEPSCSFRAQDVDFGSHGVLREPATATGAVLVTCTVDTAYTVSLGPGGAGAGTPPSDRRMLNSAGSAIRYGLYRDSAMVQGWGDEPGSIASATGSGGEQHHPVFGRVPLQPTPEPGLYSDTVIVTVTIVD